MTAAAAPAQRPTTLAVVRGLGHTYGDGDGGVILILRRAIRCFDVSFGC